MPTDIVILGTNGNCLDILDTIDCINSRSGRRIYVCRGFLDDNPALEGKSLCGVKILGPLARAGSMGDCLFVNGIGSPTNYLHKDAIIARTEIPLARFVTLVHPAATVAKSAQLGRGTVVFANATITSQARIGNHVVILPNAVISHDVVIGDYSCITGGVCISGGTRVGRQCYLGTNSAITGNITIGDFCLIGMGSVVLADVAANSVVVGNPARFLRPAR